MINEKKFWMFQIDKENRLEPLMGDSRALLRQGLPKVYSLNGAVYITGIEQLKNTESFLTDETIGYVMPRERSIDIDTLIDFRLCEILIENNASRTMQGRTDVFVK